MTRSAMIRSVMALFAVVAVAGCGSSTTSASGVGPSGSSSADTTTTTVAPDPQEVAALDAWSTFPVAATPRPVILLEGSVVGPDGGFAADEDKEAFSSGAIIPPASFPSGPSESGGYPIGTAAAAVDTLRSSGTPSPPGGTATRPLRVTGVELGTASFLTDRGYQPLPAWNISLSNVGHPVAVLAVDPAALFSPPSPTDRPSQLGAHITADPRVLTIDFAGAAEGTGPCTSDYDAHVVESATAVAVRIDETRHGAGPGTNCTSVAYPRHLAIDLASPFGARVLVDAETKVASPVA